MKKAAIIQSNYIPWKGYFDMIHDVDLFVFLDDVQYTIRDWRNRNLVKTPDGLRWLTVPVGTNRNRLICDVQISDPSWQVVHRNTLSRVYSECPFFDDYKEFLDDVYLEKKWSSLSELNQFIIKSIARDVLNIETEFVGSGELGVPGRSSARIVGICREVGADAYVSGPSARNYLDEKKFEDAGITLAYKDYSGYPEYPQLHPPFVHEVSILDLLLQTGKKADYYIWGWRESKRALNGETSCRSV